MTMILMEVTAPPVAPRLVQRRERPAEFFRIWALLIVKPSKGFEALRDKPAPRWGLYGVLVRYILTALIVPLSLYLLGRHPFWPSYLSFIPTSRYYLVEALWMPLFGVLIWLLMSAVANTAVRLAGGPSSFDLVLNVVGMGLLTPMLVVWSWDALMIALGAYTVIVMAVSHTIAQTWEGIVEAIGFRRLGGYSWRAAVLSAIGINVVYIAIAMIIVR